MIGFPTLTVSPSLANSFSIVPANGHGSSTIDFAVSISQITWFTVTWSPAATFQETISASVSPSPTSGKLNTASVIFLPFLSRRASDLLLLESDQRRVGTVLQVWQVDKEHRSFQL